MTEGFEEKKWFIYLTDHHEGPFSAAELQVKVRNGHVGEAHYVWAEGMPDWQMMKEVSAFSSQAASEGSGAGEAFLPLDAPWEPTVMAVRSSASILAPSAMAIRQAAIPAPEPLPRSGGNRILLAGVMAALVAIFGLLGVLVVLLNGRSSRYPGIHAAVQPVAHWLTERYPALGNVLSTVPKLEDVKPEELRALRSAAGTPLGRDGPRLAIALSAADPENPVFYVASNLPDGARITIHLDGVADTLLNQLTSQSELNVTLSGNFGRSEVARLADGKPLPRGEYRVIAVDAPAQPPEVKKLLLERPSVTLSHSPWPDREVRLIGKKTLFLGGPRDQNYFARLKEFHDKVHDKAVSELAELKQFSSTLESQLNSLVAKSEELRKGKASRMAARKKAWAGFDAQWSGLEDQLDQSFRKWTPETIKSEVFYDSLYDQLTRSGQLIDQVHELEGESLGGTDPHSDPESGLKAEQAVTAAQAAVARLKASIDQAEKAPPTAGGLPQKEGI